MKTVPARTVSARRTERTPIFLVKPLLHYSDNSYFSGNDEQHASANQPAVGQVISWYEANKTSGIAEPKFEQYC